MRCSVRLILASINLYEYGPNTHIWVDPLGGIIFKRWRRGDAIDKPLANGKAPSWDVVRSRYWKNRYEATKGTNEFSKSNLARMKRGSAPLDSNGNPYELHHHNPQ